MKKIIITAPHIVKNDGRLLRQYKLLNDAGFKVKFIAPDKGANSNNLVSFVNWPQRSINSITRFLPAPIKRFIEHRIKNFYWTKVLRDENPDLIIASEPEGLIAAQAACGARTALIYDCHEFYDDETDDIGRNQWAAKIHARYIYKADYLLSVSRGILDLYREKYKNLKSFEIMMNVSPFKKQIYDGRLHKALGLEIDKKIVLFHGNLREGRGIERFPQIAANIDSNSCFAIIGNGALKDFIKDSASEKLRFLPEIPYDEIEKYLCGANLGLILYVPQNLNQKWCAPNKLFELSNLGVPILAYDSPSMVEFQNDLKNLNLIPSDSDDREIANRINEIITRPIENFQIPNEYTLDYQGAKFLELVKSALKLNQA